MPPEENVKLSIEYRGTLLHEIINLETGLNIFLMEFFCRDVNREVDFHKLILGDERMNLGAKIQIVKYIISNYTKDWALEYSSIINDDRKKGRIPLNSDLVKMAEHRNIFAHRMLFEKDGLLSHIEKEENTIRFIKIKDAVLPLDYDEQTFGNIINCIQNMANHFYSHKFNW
ncbi:hypothetical protein [Mucilaginibacter sp.]|uniref:hypothetical protein n=1 Tax=Mucilaginibacter sp. TaxID=1882438 RepID=UPI003D0AE147